MLTVIASALLATTPTPMSLEVGRFDAASFPEARLRERRLPLENMLVTVERILQQRRCVLAGQSHRRFDIRVPYVVMIEPDGTATRAVVADVGCEPIERYVGSVVRELARAGDFRPTGAEEAKWYSNELRFTVH